MQNPIKKTTREILEANENRSSPLREHFILWAHDIRSMHNVGSLFRTADAFGIHQLWLSGFTPFPPRPEISKTALGADEFVEWRQIPEPSAAARDLKESGYLLVGMEQTRQSESLTEQHYETDKICLLLGNEVTGLDDTLLPLVHKCIEIPQYGQKHSLNVSVAAGVALYSYLHLSIAYEG
ncbi:MAG: TrmH family RNA methyltransferase [Balneolaceae bacterium]